MKRFLHNVVERMKSMKDGRRTTQYKIHCESDTVEIEWLTVENGTGSISFDWDRIMSVDAFKRDLLCVDCICLAFETPEGWIEVNEDMQGWHDFLGVVETQLPNFPHRDNWWNTVAVPAFETNHARLWTRKK